ncbi:MAG: DMT family transporter [Candidatus Marinimicrobia bacterium]|nr:DMT family transporter [Candidatus Neomarinimicrobiota bacterium]MBT3496024.1 DMT family transporter [Candidatus Neomarinimicrobiota bacterium]MBT3691733.1 DMT family transporter [Candidatus Neomarinimicrobiota bacterium]
MKLKIISLYILLCSIWGTTWIILKMSLNEGTPPFFGVAIRFVFASIILWGLLFYRKEKLPMSKEAWALYLQFALLNFVMSYSLTYWATQFVYSSVSAIIWAGFPLVITFISHFMLINEKLTWSKLGTILFGTAGVLLMLSQGKELGGNNVVLGVSALGIAVLVAAWPNVYLKKHHHLLSTVQLNVVSQSIAAILLMSISMIFESDRIMVWSSFNIFAIVYLTIFGTVITWLIYVWLFSHLSMPQISYVAFFPPVIATVLGWIYLDEVLTFIAIVGAGMVIAGAVFIHWLAPSKRGA